MMTNRHAGRFAPRAAERADQSDSHLSPRRPRPELGGNGSCCFLGENGSDNWGIVALSATDIPLFQAKKRIARWQEWPLPEPVANVVGDFRAQPTRVPGTGGRARA